MRLTIGYALLLVSMSHVAFACKPLPPGVNVPILKKASLIELHDYASHVLKGIPEEVSPELTNKGIVRVRVVEWTKGTGPFELMVEGFHNGGPPPICPGDRPNVAVFGKRHWIVLDGPPNGDRARLIVGPSIPAGIVSRVIFPAENF